LLDKKTDDFGVIVPRKTVIELLKILKAGILKLHAEYKRHKGQEQCTDFPIGK
jgi:DNA polymerase III sliding clamp (beta) subunit (PCNA family)